MKHTLLTSLIALGLFTASCKKEKEETPAPDRQISKAEWLLGRWENPSKDGLYEETWVKANDSVLNGASYYISGKDTLFSETVVLDEVAGKMAYTVTVPGQNNEQPVRFDLTKITDTEIVFENPKHDYPNKIVYTQVKPDSLVAVIYGTQKGKPASENFPMKKVK
ncbi:DUF6265 family protein [Flavobacterium sp. RHBU_3]|uniref:DUF6265 family protein n=1 Tax=Flavobacterium sp. RHBU_3 TaxID=3391184 RepID=UPI003984D63B